MDCSDDARDPWDREEEEELLGEPESLFAHRLPPEEGMSWEESTRDPDSEEPTASLGDETCTPSECEESTASHSPRLPVQEVAAENEPTAVSNVTAVSLRLLSDASPPNLCRLAEETTLQPEPKLRRLRQKTTVPAELLLPSKHTRDFDLPEALSEEFLTNHFWRKLTSSQQYNYVYEKLRSLYVSKVHESSLRGAERAEWQQLVGAERQKRGRKAFKDLEPVRRAELARHWSELTCPPPFIHKVIKESFIDVTAAHPGGIFKQRTTGALLTWILPETVLDLSIVIRKGESTASLDGIVAELRTSSEVQKLWGDILEHGHKCMHLAEGTDVSVCLEVCPQTFELQNVVRLHIHAFVKSNGAPLQLKHLNQFAFGDAGAHVSTSIAGCTTSRRNERSQWSGFMYCCLKDKKGTVCADATKLPFRGFLVNPTWIMNLVQSKKLEVGPARGLLVQCGNASRHLNELNVYETELERLAVQDAIAEATRLLSHILKPQRQYPKVQAFLNQFKTPRPRYKFLVLSGPSRVGKTAFACSLCEPTAQTLELNCSSGAEPDMRGYRFRKHDLVLFDEIRAEQVAEQRKLFQAQAALVQLGCSATNCHSYEVFVWRKKLVLASNNWHASLCLLPAADREWVKANSIVMDVMEAMWCD